MATAYNFKAKVDPAQNIVVFWDHAASGDFPGMEEILDPEMNTGYHRYVGINSSIIAECKAKCFCVLAHGGPAALCGLNDQESMGRIIIYHQTYGRGRDLLLLSCLTGLQLGRRIAGNLGVDVITPTGPAWIGGAGEIYTLDDQRTPNLDGALNWIRVKPSGEIIYSGTEELHPSFITP